MRVCVCVCIYMCVFVCICIYISIYVCVCVCICMHIFLSMYVYRYIYGYKFSPLLQGFLLLLLILLLLQLSWHYESHKLFAYTILDTTDKRNIWCPQGNEKPHEHRRSDPRAYTLIKTHIHTTINKSPLPTKPMQIFIPQIHG